MWLAFPNLVLQPVNVELELAGFDRLAEIALI